MHAPPPDLAVLAMAKLWPPPPDLAVGAGDPVDHRRIWRWQLAQLGGLAALAGRWRAFAGRAAQHADPGRKAPRRPASAAGDSQIARPGRWPAPGHFTFSPRRPGGPYRRIWRYGPDPWAAATAGSGDTGEIKRAGPYRRARPARLAIKLLELDRDRDPLVPGPLCSRGYVIRHPSDRERYHPGNLGRNAKRRLPYPDRRRLAQPKKQ